MDVNLEYYKTFYNVATYGNMTKAAAMLNLTPPTVSKTIQLLEQQLNCRLFNRNGKGVVLTEEGAALFQKVKPALDLIKSAEDEIDSVNKMQKGKLRIGMSDIMTCVLSDSGLFERFFTEYPNVELIIRKQSPAETNKSLACGEIDLAVMSLFKKTVRENIQSHEVGGFGNVAVVGKKFEFLSQTPLSLKELNEYPLVFWQHAYGVTEKFEEMYSKYDLSFNPRIVVSSLDALVRLVLSGIGYSILPNIYAKGYIDDGRLFPLKLVDTEMFGGSICIFTPKNVPLRQSAQVFIEMLKEHIEENKTKYSAEI